MTAALISALLLSCNQSRSSVKLLTFQHEAFSAVDSAGLWQPPLCFRSSAVLWNTVHDKSYQMFIVYDSIFHLYCVFSLDWKISILGILNFCANNYLGLSSHPEVVQAGIDALKTHGAGLSSVRFICGTQVRWLLIPSEPQNC